MGFKDVWAAFAAKVRRHGLGPDTRCSLLELCGVWSGQAQSQTTGRDARRTTAICRLTPGDTRTASSCKKDMIEFTNSFVSMKGGARDLFVHPRASCTHLLFPRPYLIPSAPSPPPPCTQPGSSMAFDLAEKIDGKRRRALRTPDDDMSLRQGYLRDVL